MPVLEQAAMVALSVFPEETWDIDDDACDCTFQRIGFWTNPYIGETLEVRMCCIWEELYKLFPQFVRKTDAFQNYNSGEWETLREWDGETEMPRSIWYRQLAKQTGTPLAEIRASYGHLTPPQGTPRPKPEPGVSLQSAILAQLVSLNRRLSALEAK